MLALILSRLAHSFSTTYIHYPAFPPSHLPSLYIKRSSLTTKPFITATPTYKMNSPFNFDFMANVAGPSSSRISHLSPTQAASQVGKDSPRPFKIPVSPLQHSIYVPPEIISTLTRNRTWLRREGCPRSTCVRFTARGSTLKIRTRGAPHCPMG